MSGYRWLDDLDQCFNAAAVPYIEIGYSSIDPTYASSWRDRGRPSSAGGFDPGGVLCHHTASSAGTSDEAELNVILAGNGSAPGPISQLFIGRSGLLYLVAAGRANHGGGGVIPGESNDDDMNDRLLGIEVANNGVGEYWEDHVTTMYAATVAALNDWYGWDCSSTYLHATTGPPAGNYKIDPAGPWCRQPDLGGGTWDLDTWRAFVDEHHGAPAPQPEEDDVAFACPLFIEATGADGTTPGAVYATDGRFTAIRWLNQWEWQDAQYWAREAGQDCTAVRVDRIYSFGALVGPPPS